MANKLFPGKPNYTGPKIGYFTLLHHQGPIVDWSNDVMERVEYINRYKPGYERAIRLSHIVHVPTSMVHDAVQEAYAKRQEADAKWRDAHAKWQEADAKCRDAYAKWQEADAKWRDAYAKRREADAKWREVDTKWQEAEADKLTAYLKLHVKDCRWNGTELDFRKS